MSERKYMSSFYNGFRNEIGILSANIPSRAGGKKLLEWTFRAKGYDEDIPVTVHLEQGPKGMLFSAHCNRLAQQVTDTDINRLYAVVESQLIDQSSSMSNIEWEDWFEVVVKGENSDFTDSDHSALGANLHIQVNRLKRGIHPVSGDAVTINVNGVVVRFPEATKLSDGPINSGTFRIQSATGRSYIPDTSENENALRNILVRMEMLRGSLAEVLNQGNVSKVLDSLELSIPLLSANH